MVLNLAYSTDREFGPTFGNLYDWTFGQVVGLVTDWTPGPMEHSPLGDITISGNSNLRSGRPYTFSTGGQQLVNNKRSPVEWTTDLKISKRIRKFFGADATLALEIFNVFNDRIYSYTSVFQSVTSTSTQGSTNNQNIEKYETRRDDLMYYDLNYPFLVNQEFLLFGNEPRSFWLSLVINL
jgi:hypothetical protein